MKTPEITIIGAGMAAYQLVKDIRRHSKDIGIRILTKDTGDYYSKPMLSTAFAKNKTAETLVMQSGPSMKETLNIDLISMCEVTSISVEDKVLTTTQGDFEFNKLVFATGAHPVSLNVAGSNAENSFSINDLQDFDLFQKATLNKKDILIMGAGLIGCEYANDLAQAGFKVTVVDVQNYALSQLVPKPVSDFLVSVLEQHGVRFEFNKAVTSMNTESSRTQVTLSDGSEVVVDAVLSAVGLRPDISLATMAGLECGRGIKVNANLQTSHPDIYAIGDCAEVAGHLLFYIAPMMQCSKVLAQNLATEQEAQVQYGVMPVPIKTTLCPLVVYSSGRNTDGSWQCDGDETGVKATLEHNGEIIGFAAIGKKARESAFLARQSLPIMSQSS